MPSEGRSGSNTAIHFSNSWSASRRDRARAWLAELAGRCEYHLRPRRRDDWGGPFNGQERRQELVAELAARIEMAAVVETGTYRATTTAHLRHITAVPIHSFEANPRHYGFALQHLRGMPGIHLHCCDSRSGLRALLASNTLPHGSVFFYLDAHGYEHFDAYGIGSSRALGNADLPLADELRSVFCHHPEAVVMIDDFAVPGDPGYGFDSDVAGRCIGLDYLVENDVLPAALWFPRAPSESETGARRGCAVLAQSADVARRVDTMATLRRWNSAS